MSLQDDIDRIKQMEDSYFVEHDEYFETDNHKVVTISDIGEDKKLTQFTKFKGNRDKTPETSKIDFIPSEKDYKITIGQVIFVNSAEGGYKKNAEKRAYMIRTERRNATGEIETTVQYGGDQWVIDNFTDGDSYLEIKPTDTEITKDG